MPTTIPALVQSAQKNTRSAGESKIQPATWVQWACDGITGAFQANGIIGSTPLTSIDVTGNTIAIKAVTTSGTQAYSAIGGVTLNGNLSTTNNNVTITGPTTLGADLTISTNTGVGNITFSGATSTITGAKALVLTAGIGDVVLGGVVGATPLTSINLAMNGANGALPPG